MENRFLAFWSGVGEGGGAAARELLTVKMGNLIRLAAAGTAALSPGAERAKFDPCLLNPNLRPLSPPPLFPNPENRTAVSGTACCLISALAYTAANICMRQLTALRCDPILAVFGRELVTAVAAAPWLFYRVFRGRTSLPGKDALIRLVLAGLLIQVVGNVVNQWALGVVGLAVTVCVVFGATIASGALLGRLFLAEKVSYRSMASIALLLASLTLLGIGAEAAGPAIGADGHASSPLRLLAGVAAAALAGATFAVLNIVIRHSVTRATSPLVIAFLVPMVGALSLGPSALFRLGLQPLYDASWQQLAMMAVAGAFNLVAFTAVILGLQRINVVHANMISASQVAMAAVAGMLIFSEPPNGWLLSGIVLTMAGILAIDRPAESVDV